MCFLVLCKMIYFIILIKVPWKTVEIRFFLKTFRTLWKEVNCTSSKRCKHDMPPLSTPLWGYELSLVSLVVHRFDNVLGWIDDEILWTHWNTHLVEQWIGINGPNPWKTSRDGSIFSWLLHEDSQQGNPRHGAQDSHVYRR